MIMSPSDNTNIPQPIAPEPKKEGFFDKVAGLFKKKPSAPAVPPGFTSQTPEPKLDNLPTDGSVPLGVTPPPQATPLADVALAQTTVLPVDPSAPVVTQPTVPEVPVAAPVQPSPVFPVATDPVATPAPTQVPPAAGAVPSPFGEPVPATPAVPVQPAQPLQPPVAPAASPQFPPQQPPTPGA